MFHVFYITIILVLAVLYIAALRREWRLKDQIDDTEARERGLNEIEENYQAEIMTLLEQRQNAWNRAESLTQENDDLKEEITGLRKQLDISQKIISEHDLNCLPHVVFENKD